MVVKTYPTPSSKYGELVCTAGVDVDSGMWMRVYPYPFRTGPPSAQFKKFDVLELPVTKATGEDKRPDSYRLSDIDSVRKLDHIGSEGGTWSTRLRYLLPSAVDDIRAFQDRMLPDATSPWGQSIGLVRAQADSAKLTAVPRESAWSEEELAKLRRARDRVQTNLFASEEAKAYFADLRRIPFEFRLEFRDLGAKEYRLPILDWEIARLYLRHETQGEAKAVSAVRHKIENEIFGPSREVFLVVGNIYHRFRNRSAIAIDGFVWPRASASQQGRLF